MRSRLVNEAKFLRALAYFNLVRIYGSVPLIIADAEPLYPASASADAAYAQIINDLKSAESLPLDGEYSGRAGDERRGKSLVGKSLSNEERVEKCLG